MYYRVSIFLLAILATSHYAMGSTGILEVHSNPKGAKVYIDNIYVGVTPYSNPEVSLGRHIVRVFLSKNYPSLEKAVSINEIDPQILKFEFQKSDSGKFTGIKEEIKTDIKKGNIQFASIPSGSKVFIDNDEKGNTPLGYRDVPVGVYKVKFVSNGKTLTGIFRIEAGLNEKLIANFDSGQILSKLKEERDRNELLKENQKKELASARRRNELKKKEEQVKKLEQERLNEMKRLFSISMPSMRDTHSSGGFNKTINLNNESIEYFKIPFSTISISSSMKKKIWPAGYEGLMTVSAGENTITKKIYQSTRYYTFYMPIENGNQIKFYYSVEGSSMIKGRGNLTATINN